MLTVWPRFCLNNGVDGSCNAEEPWLFPLSSSDVIPISPLTRRFVWSTHQLCLYVLWMISKIETFFMCLLLSSSEQGCTVSRTTPFPHQMILLKRAQKMPLFDQGNLCALVDKSISYRHGQILTPMCRGNLMLWGFCISSMTGVTPERFTASVVTLSQCPLWASKIESSCCERIPTPAMNCQDSSKLHHRCWKCFSKPAFPCLYKTLKCRYWSFFCKTCSFQFLIQVRNS